MEDDPRTLRSPNGAPRADPEIGPKLEQARKDRGLSLEEAEHATKIRKRYLDGLERDDYGVLPDTVYARGFLKTYANYLGLDGEELARELKDRRKPRRERGAAPGAPWGDDFDRPLVSLNDLVGKRRRWISPRALLTLVVGLLVLAAVVGSLYFVGLGAQSADQNPEPPAPAPNAAAEEPQPGAAPGAGENRPPEGAQPAPPPPPEVLTVAVSVRRDPSWLSILTDGELAYEQIAMPGFSKTFEAERNISIKTGNAGAVGVEVNGEDRGTLGESGEVLTRRFTLEDAS